MYCLATIAYQTKEGQAIPVLVPGSFLGTFDSASKKLPADHPIFDRLCGVMQFETSQNEWSNLAPCVCHQYSYTFRFGLAEQAINAIYLLASQPDILCGKIIKAKSASVFGKDSKISETSDISEPESVEFKGLSPVRSLSQLVFIVGHVASRSHSSTES